MTDYPTLTHSPIQVAILEIRFFSDTAILDASYEKAYHKHIQDLYPTSNNGMERNINIEALPGGKEKVSVSNGEVIEFRYVSADKNKTLVINSRRFSITVNASYKDWEEFTKEFSHLWDIYYHKFLDPQRNIIEGISTRFINRMEVTGLTTPAAFFNTTIYADEGVIPGVVDSYLMRYTTNVVEDSIQIHVTQGFETPINNISPYTFDVDVVYNRQLLYDDLKPALDLLRVHKNNVFFKNLTEITLNSLK